MRLIDDEVVDARVLETHPRVPVGVDAGLDLVLQLEQLALDAFDAHPVLTLGVFEHAADLLDLPVDVSGLGLGPQRDLRERTLGQDHGVPLVRRRSCDEQAAFVGSQVVAGRGENPCPWVDLQPLAADLFEHVIGDHDDGFGDQSHAAHLHRAHHHLGGLARADLMEQPGRGLGDHPCHRGPLVWTWCERRRHAGQRQVLPGIGVIPEHDGVEPTVVLIGQSTGAFGVFPHPLAEAFLDRLGLLLGGRGLDRVEHLALLPGHVFDLVVDQQRPLLHDRLSDIGCRAAFGAPLARR